ncbi:Bug family tripartite tricarboxylate transporter substrate binding protein [Advenella sp. RU8]|jgi:tripartite-type tricarboxylate transporter receptor subunit TctC|uniref:Bug family tripartite tricarboxylate transporter substrate binding protein n=1 Tax=Advenella sp. RU8 TaxID=3399575 RepID=UPI0016BB7F28|nr:tripartite tricarboxylate transporter substrate binding protein [Alcaligenaceae bacterium]
MDTVLSFYASGGRVFKNFAAVLISCTLATPVLAAEWPKQPVRLVVPFAAGGATDIISRTLGQELGKQWKQTVIVENKVGAGGAVGASQVARAKPDGYTLLMISGSMFTVNPYLYKKLPYSVNDFRAVSAVTAGPLLMAVNKKIPANDLHSFMNYVKAHGAVTNFGSAGVGSQGHMASEAIMNATGTQMTHIPYSGESAALTDLMAGQIDVVTANLSAVLPFLKSGEVKPIAVTSGKRSKSVSDVGTMAEQLNKDFDVVGWFGIAVPKETPDAVVKQIEEGIKVALNSDRMKRTFDDLGLEPATTGSDYMNGRVQEESTFWQKVIAEQKIEPR